MVTAPPDHQKSRSRGSCQYRFFLCARARARASANRRRGECRGVFSKHQLGDGACCDGWCDGWCDDHPSQKDVRTDGGDVVVRRLRRLTRPSTNDEDRRPTTDRRRTVDRLFRARPGSIVAPSQAEGRGPGYPSRLTHGEYVFPPAWARAGGLASRERGSYLS